MTMTQNRKQKPATNKRKAIIYKSHTIERDTSVLAVYLFGVCIYIAERPINDSTNSHAVGFVSYDNDAAGYVDDDDYFTDEI